VDPKGTRGRLLLSPPVMRLNKLRKIKDFLNVFTAILNDLSLNVLIIKFLPKRQLCVYIKIINRLTLFSRSYFTTDGQSWYRAPLWDLRPDITSCLNAAV
jgi:hypothetical protein